MKKMVIILEYENENAEKLGQLMQSVDVAQLLRDALGEFVSKRAGGGDSELSVSEYMTKRYPLLQGAARAAKVAEIELRVRTAQSLMRTAEITMQHDEDDDREDVEQDNL